MTTNRTNANTEQIKKHKDSYTEKCFYFPHSLLRKGEKYFLLILWAKLCSAWGRVCRLSGFSFKITRFTLSRVFPRTKIIWKWEKKTAFVALTPFILVYLLSFSIFSLCNCVLLPQFSTFIQSVKGRVFHSVVLLAAFFHPLWYYFFCL